MKPSAAIAPRSAIAQTRTFHRGEGGRPSGKSRSTSGTATSGITKAQLFSHASGTNIVSDPVTRPRVTNSSANAVTANPVAIAPKSHPSRCGDDATRSARRRRRTEDERDPPDERRVLIALDELPLDHDGGDEQRHVERQERPRSARRDGRSLVPSTGRVPIEVVPAPGAHRTVRWPPSAASRSAMPWSPAALGGRRVEPASVVGDLERQHAVRLRQAHVAVAPPRTSRRSAAPPGRRSRRPPRSLRIATDPVGSTSTGSGAFRAWGAKARPRAPGPPGSAGRCRARDRAGSPGRRSCPSSPRPPCAPPRRPSERSVARRDPASPASATSCCCAPSWMSRSSFLARSSCAATIRRRDSGGRPPARRSAGRARPVPRRRSPVVPARGHRLVRRHRDADLAERVALVSNLEGTFPRTRGGIGGGPGRDRDGAAPVPSRIATRSAPMPSPRTRATRGSTSSSEYVSPRRSENPASTSYGVARSPYTIRFARCWARPQRLEEQRHDGGRRGGEERAPRCPRGSRSPRRSRRRSR